MPELPGTDGTALWTRLSKHGIATTSFNILYAFLTGFGSLT